MKILAISTLLLLCCSQIVGGGRLTPLGQTGPHIPYEDAGACPFECCTYREWTVLSPTAIHSQRSETSPVGFRVGKGERVTGMTGVVITLRAGRSVVKKATTLGEGNQSVRVKAGDVLYVLHYMGEGFYKFWYGGRIYDAELDDRVIRTVSQPQTVWWVKVKNRRGQVGWSRQPTHFGNMDACG